MLKQIIFNKICKDIKSLKIQSATTLARKAFYAYKLIPTEESKNKLLGLRPTEPMLYNLLSRYENITYEDLSKKLVEFQEKINQEVFNLIKNNDIIFTHCHATSITNALINAKKKGKKFEVYNTETRPLYQGRKTSKELRRAEIKVTMYVDAAALIALTKTQQHKKANIIFLGADAITRKGVINKVGSGMYAELAKLHKIPLYIVTNSLKYTGKPIKIEERSKQEVWNSTKIKIENPAFEIVPKDLITGIITEFGTQTFDKFLKKVEK
jgi:methylthioribose-1-phosphate isomerase